jgi:TolA-binding protein
VLNKIKEFASNEKINIIFVILLLVGLVVAWDLFGNSNVSDNSRGIESIQTEYQRDQERSRSITTGLGTVEQRIDGSIKTVERIEIRNKSIESSITTVIERNKTDESRIERINRLLDKEQQRLERIQQSCEK